MKVIGIIGRRGAGKTELANYLAQQYDVPSLAIGEMALEMVDQAVYPETEHDPTGRQVAEHGSSHFILRIMEAIEANEWAVVALTGIETGAHVATLKENFGSDLLLVHVTSDDQERFKRLKKRHYQTDPLTHEQFLQAETAANLNLDECALQADLVIENDDDVKRFHREIDARITPHLTG
jgi:dephospho-CoA kinase